MNTPWPRQRELAALREAVTAAATRVLEAEHSEYAERFRSALRESGDVDKALDLAGRLPPDSPFGPWRRVLTTLVEQEMYAVQVKTALYLLRTAVPPDLQDISGTVQGAWVVYHTQAALAWMTAAVECARRLVSSVCRTCLRPYDPGWTAFSASTLRPLTELGGKIDALRERFTEDAWTARQLERELIWDGAVLGGRPLGTWAVWWYAAQYRRPWARELDTLGRQFVFAVERACTRLRLEVPWEAIG